MSEGESSFKGEIITPKDNLIEPIDVENTQPVAGGDVPLSENAEVNQQVEEADQIALLLQDVSESSEEDSGVPAAGQKELMTPQATLDLKVEEPKETVSVKLMERIDQSLLSENKFLEGVAPAEQNQKRIEFKTQYIADEKKKGRVRVAEHTMPMLLEDTVQMKEEKTREREMIARDLETVDMNAFYARYFAIMRGEQTARPKELLMLESSLGGFLRAAAEKRGAPDAYDAEKIHQVFLSLTQSEEMERVAFLLYQERMKIALEIDQKLGTNVSGEIEKIIKSSLPPAQKLKSMDAILNGVANIATKDEQLQIKLHELKSLNKRQDAANTALEMRLIEDHITLQTQKQDLQKTLHAINKNFPTMPEAGIKLFSDGVQEGRLGLVSALLGGTVVAMTGAAMLSSPESAGYAGSEPSGETFGGNLKAMPDGSYKGKVEGETVILARQNGRVTAYLQYGEAKIPIPVTDPDAVGFDLARSEKIAMEMGSREIRNRLDVRWALMDHPEDSEFMDNRQAKKFREILHIVLRNTGADAEGALRKYSLLRENRTVNEKYVDALKRCFDVWAPEGNYEDLFPVIEETDLLKLVALWKHEEAGRVEESVTLRTYTLAEIRSGKGRL